VTRAGGRAASATPLWLRGLRSRPLVNALLLVLASVAVATAVLGPLLIRAVHQFTVQSSVAAAPRDQTTITLSLPAQGDTPRALAAAYDLRSGILTGLLEIALVRSGSAAWREPEVAITSSGNLAWTAGDAPATDAVSSRVNAVKASCAGYVQLTLTQLASGIERLRVVGIYDPAASDRGQLIRPGTPAGGLAAVTAEPLLVSPDQAAALLLPAVASGRLALGPEVTIPDLAGIRATVAAVNSGVLDQPELISLVTDVPQLLDRIDDQARAAAILMAVTVAQAVGLALFATAVVLQRMARARAAEWG
jgi:hypothetical protein